MSQSVRWVTFGLSNALTRTVVHFYPSEGSVTAPYPASCSLRIFGGSASNGTMQEKKVTIEGARLSHPDGVRAEDAFPMLKSEQIGLFGLEIELSTTQPRVDMEGSSCVVELASKGYSARFWPKRIVQPPVVQPPPLLSSSKAEQALKEREEEAGATLSRAVPLVKDSYGSSSLILVNGSHSSFISGARIDGALDSLGGFSVPTLTSLSCAEVSPEESVFNSVLPLECSWGLVRTRSLFVEEINPFEPCAVYVVYRDALTRRPVSVVAV